MQTEGGPALRMKRGPMPPVVLRYEGDMTFTDGRGHFTFGPAGIWADLGVSLVYWPRT